jgi:hypothetical protein
MRSTQGETLSSDTARLSRLVVERLWFDAREEIAFDARALGFAASVSHARTHSQLAGWTKFRSPRSSRGVGTQVIVSRGRRLRSANKAPEPTPTSVMPRAISRVAVLKQWNVEPNPARVMPDAVVAHL